MPTRLQKTQVVMHKRQVAKSMPPHLVAFETDREDTADSDHRFKMDRRIYEEMGGPDTITVTVEPGDALNERD